MIATNPTFARGETGQRPAQEEAPTRHLFTDPLVAYSVPDVKQNGVGSDRLRVRSDGAQVD